MNLFADDEGDVRAPLWARLAERATTADAEAVVGFARRLLVRAPGSVATRNDATLVALVESTWRFVAAPGAVPRLRAFTPIAARDGWDGDGGVVQLLQGDRPFIVDTVRATLAAADIEVHALLHPVFDARRDDGGRLLGLGGDGTRRESLIHVELPPLEPERLAAVADTLRDRLEDLAAVTDDFGLMVARAHATAAELRWGGPGDEAEADPRAAADLLRWLVDGNFVFLGSREYVVEGLGEARALRVRPGGGLGLLRDDARSTFARARRLTDLPPAVRRSVDGRVRIVVDRTHAVAPVHRREHMVDVRVLVRDTDARLTLVRRFVGLFTSRAHAAEAADVPVLRDALRELLAAEHVDPGTHDWRERVAAFNAVPKSVLFASTRDERQRDVELLLASARSERVVVSAAPRAAGRRLRLLAVVPPERFAGDAAARIVDVVRARLGGEVLDEELHVEEEGPARLFLLVAPASPVDDAERAALERDVAAVFGTWAERLRAALVAGYGPTDGARLAARWAEAFPADYRATVEPARAAADVARLDDAATRAASVVALEAGSGGEPAVLRVYRPGEPLVLADVLPVLDHLGLRVLGEDRIAVAGAHGTAVWLHRLAVQDRRGAPLDVTTLGARVVETLHAVWDGRTADDVLNRLVVDAGLGWRAVDVLRAYAGWAVQAGAGTHGEVWGALAEHPLPAARLYDVFAARFADVRGDGAAPADRGSQAAARAAFHASLDAVPSLREDQVLRALLAAVEATVRTNAATRADDCRWLAFKIRSGDVPRLPLPRPLFEIWVHAPDVTGIHLRAGRVARGGIRLSDRPEDFRTEVLGLMKTQTVKNAVIVPTGAKGAFVPAAGVAPLDAYRTYVHALLDVTDDVRDGRVVHPPGRILDDDDPYLVVAADKGTATFSDAANAIATARGFWLGDAFASGGSHGYDHKALGITARGAWECVRTHARALGVDADTAPLTVVGIGDMSGDVFGNGLLQSAHVRLRAAFDHRHVFLDPDPDPVRSADERARCFQERRGWDGYDRAALSPGGMIVARAAKQIVPTPEARAMLGLDDEAVSGERLVRAVLGMEADLLWNGGIGTYVRAGDESDAAVGDPANDGVRITADALRVRIVAEGGNLGLTQRARVAFALRGGLVNTDAIDNSAGVDCSDHEVNLKICLQPLVAAGRLQDAERNALLAEVTEDVVVRVLDHNRRQSRLLGVDQVRSRTRLGDFLELVAELARGGQLDRALEALPDREALRARRGAYLGLTRPELAVITAHAKLALEGVLQEDPLCDDALFAPWLAAYFPARIGARFPEALASHRLRRAIVASEVANAVVDALGATFLLRLCRDTGADVVAAVRAWAIAWAVGDGGSLDAALRAAALPPDAEAAGRLALESAFEAACRWLVGHTTPTHAPSTVAAALSGAIAPLRQRLPAWLAGAEAEASAQRREALAAAGLPAPLAASLAAADLTAGLLDVAAVAWRGRLDVAEAGARYFALATSLDFPWLLARCAEARADERWQRQAVDGLVEDVLDARRRLVTVSADALPARQLESVRAILRDLRTAPRVPLAALLVLVRELRRLADLVGDPLAHREQDRPW